MRTSIMRFTGGSIAIGGSVASVCAFWIDHMNPALWTFLATGVGVSTVVGAAMIWLARPKR